MIDLTLLEVSLRAGRFLRGRCGVGRGVSLEQDPATARLPVRLRDLLRIDAAKEVFGEGKPKARSAFEAGRSGLIERGWPGVCGWVGGLVSASDAKERERRRQITDRVIGYFSKHVGGLNYAERLRSGRAIGSGVVEGWAKTLGLRLKIRGARWNRRNVRPMASLIRVRHSPQWESY